MNIEKIEMILHERYVFHKARIGFQHLWFRLPSTFLHDPCDVSAFLVSALHPAMLLGEDITIDDVYFVSKQLLFNIEKIQEIYHCWNPSFKRIRIHCRAEIAENVSKSCCAFFSGGVDGTYTAYRHKEEIDQLVLINGFDFSMGNRTWQEMVDRNQFVAKGLGKELVPVETNFKTFILNFGLARSVNFSTCLVAIALLMESKTVLISAGQTYSNFFPDGSHPLIDPLWSTESTEFFPAGLNENRSGKLGFLKQYPQALENLWICWLDPRENCGICSKCMRTIVALRLNDITSVSFRQKVPIRGLLKFPLRGTHDLLFFSEFKQQAIENKDVTLIKVLTRLITIYQTKNFIKQFLRDIDLYFFNGWIENKRLLRRPKHDRYHEVGVSWRYSDVNVTEEVRQLTSEKDITRNDAIVGSVFFNDHSLDDDTRSEIMGST